MKETIIYLFRLSKRFIIPLIPILILGAIEVGLSLYLIALSKQLIDVATNAIPGNLIHTILLLAILLFVSIGLKIAISWTTVRLRVFIESRLRAHFFSHTLRAQWQQIQKYHSGDIMTRINTDIGDVVHLFSTTIPQFVLTLLRLCGAFIFMLVMNKTLALILAGLVPIVLLFSKIYFKRMRRLSKEIKETSSQVRQFFQESIQHGMIVKALRLESLFEKQLDDKQQDNIRKIKEQNRFSIFSNTILSLGFTVGYLITFSWGLFELQAGAITFGTLTAFLQLVNMIQGPALGLVSLAPSFVSVYTAGERLYELENIPQETYRKTQQLVDIQRINLKNISFAYVPKSPVLKQVNMDFKQGTMTALTGKTGCGKTTLLRLLLALIHPQEGEITISDGVSSYLVNEHTRINFSYVPQDNHLFSGTIRDNLKISNPEATDAQLIEVLRQTSADFVLKMPEGLDTILKEQGEGLSGGQIQRLAIARAFLAPGQVLLLDEVTSALDEITETEILQTIKHHLKNRIVIIVTHKHQVAAVCDAVYEVD
ncbi:ABC transporter ATP-binding protein/permease [Parabacteroides sp. OttesenSCG-928-G07]|nr:ABC transporter ATP-binding protein/permease [Parabacteroides sp. OttesenSCG-928-G21]MDL2278086.1 ABC transporter ATP-binding protein/permease [Parabacteroides sp. OttesenSCG-928-G07]